ncbi:MAG TPA: M20/M25/M40 family metallo-hydrolase [Bacteroidales bacterium]|nr:M20/M25/M40 family metallo-hydrolase [Bacteroidales bacterium]
MNSMFHFPSSCYYRLLTFVLVSLAALNGTAQNTDSVMIRKIYTEALTDTTSYHNLRYLCTRIGGRICGSPEAEQAVSWSKNLLEQMGLDTVYLQKCMVKHWVRGKEETVQVNPGGKESSPLHACALGGSVGTGPDGIKAGVVEIRDFNELPILGRKGIEGRIVFFNHPADPSFYYTFSAYGGAVAYRANGAIQAARYGAVAVLVRSATLAHDHYPHTGNMHYADTVKQIPAAAIGTLDADQLSLQLKKDPALKILIKLSCRMEPEVPSYNVIGEIRGTRFPDEVIAFGGHLDSWDLGQGAHDDGAGVVQTIEVLREFKALNIRPAHTLRVVVFMDEETDQRGAKAYDETAVRDSLKIKHIAAIECDRGGFTPFGFSIDATDQKIKELQSWKQLFLPYGIYMFEKGGSGVDIRGLKSLGTPLIALVPDSQRYFDYHHSAADTFDKVNQRELQLGSATVASLVYLIDKYGL